MIKRLLQAVCMFFAGLMLWGCTKNSMDINDNDIFIKQITTANGVSENYEYKNGKLSKQTYYSNCPNPQTENKYTYSGNRLISVTTATNAFSSASCPTGGYMTFSINFEYDNRVRVSRINYGTSTYKKLFYNGNSKFITKVYSFNAATNQPIDTIQYIRDPSGNIIETIEKTGRTFYKYDDKLNPFYLISRTPWHISVWNNSPNNVIEASGLNNFKTKILEYKNDLPKKVLETNNVVYEYHY